MYILVVDKSLEKQTLVKDFGAPQDITIKSIRTLLTKHTANGFGQGGTPFSTAMRAAFFTKKWLGDKPFFYEVSLEARPAITALRKSGRKLRVFTLNDEAMRKAFMLCEMYMYSTCFSDRYWLKPDWDGGRHTKTQLDEMQQTRENSDAEFIELVYESGFDGLNLTREARMLFEAHLEVPFGEVVTETIGSGALYTTKLGAHIIHEATRVAV